MNITDLMAQWDSKLGKPYKGKLIDMGAYRKSPDDPGCMCAQGQVLHYVGGMTATELAALDQWEADKNTAKLLNISIGHACLLRIVNDSADGAPSIVLTNPEKVIGDQAETVLAFWRHMDGMSDAAWAAAWDAAWVAARAAARDAARAAAWDAAWAAARDAAWDAAWAAARDAAWAAARDACQYATAEIMGARIMRELNQPFFFLPMFGFADPEAVLSADTEKSA